MHFSKAIIMFGKGFVNDQHLLDSTDDPSKQIIPCLQAEG